MPSQYPTTSIGEVAIRAAKGHVSDILEHAIQLEKQQATIVIWDSECELAVALAKAYQLCLPEATFIHFDRTPQQTILAAFEILEPGDLVVLIQSTKFKLAAWRIRLELFRRNLKVVEHPHLLRMPGEEALIYIDSLAYDPVYYRSVGAALKQRLAAAQVGVVHSPGEQLTFPAGFDEAKLNVGDYTGMANVGGQYPIGEVFTESRDLEAVHGRVVIALFGDMDFTVNRPASPITLVVENGRVVAVEDSTPAFDVVLESIRAAEGQIWLRELGFGMNKAFTRERVVTDIGSYERMCGVHLSLGAKHSVYNKPQIKKKHARQHVDVFVITDSVTLDGEEIYRDENWVVAS
jgi:aminopeptidase